MPRKYTKAERENLIDEAVSMSARGKTLREISAELGPTKDTINKWLNDELSRRAEHRGQDKEKAISVYLEIQEAAWDRYEKTDNRSLNASGLLNTIKSCQERIDKITGTEAPRKVEHSSTNPLSELTDEELDELEKRLS